MNTITPINELLATPAGTVIQATQGTVSKTFERKQGVSAASGKPWSMEKFVIQDGTGQITVKAMNRPPMNLQQGTLVMVYSSRGQNGGFSGCKREDDNYQGNTYQLLTCWPNAVIQAKSGGFQQPAAAPQQAAPAAAAPQVAQYRQNQPQTPRRALRPFLLQGACAVVESYKAARWASDKLAEGDGVGLTPEQLQSTAASLFIACDRKGLVDEVDPIPYLNSGTEPAEAAPQPEPEPEPEPAQEEAPDVYGQDGDSPIPF